MLARFHDLTLFQSYLIYLTEGCSYTKFGAHIVCVSACNSLPHKSYCIKLNLIQDDFLMMMMYTSPYISP